MAHNCNGPMDQEPSKYPIADMGADFQPDAMDDFDKRVASGEFKDKTMDQIREIYVQEEADFVEEQEYADNCRAIDEMEEREFQRSLGE